MRLDTFKILILLSLGFSTSCGSRIHQIHPGAYVSVDGTDDGLERVQHTFESAQRTADGIVVTLGSDVLFATNSSFLSANAKKELDRFVEMLGTAGNYTLEVSGHTDATGTAEYNLGLSEKRALSVKEYLVGKNIPDGKIVTKGYGITKPVAPNNTPEGRKKNRRVEILIK